MGFAVVGCPTRLSRYARRRHKRVHRDRHHHEVVPFVHYHQRPRGIKKKQKQQQKLVRRTFASAAKLPVEIVQELFVFSHGDKNLLLVNKYFSEALKPTAHLVGRVFWQKYSTQIGNEMALRINLFDHNLFFQYYLAHYQDILAHGISCFVDSNNSRLKYFPLSFYSHMLPITTSPRAIAALKGLLYFTDPWDFINELFYWAFTQRGMCIESLWETMDMALLLKEEDNVATSDTAFAVGPLLTTLETFYLSPQQPLLSFFSVSQTEKLAASKHAFLNYLVTRYYSANNNRESLSDPRLWNLLHQISDMQLIDFIEENGGNPQYNGQF